MAKNAVAQAVMLAVLLAVLLVRWSVNVLEAAPPRGYTRRASGRARCADCGVPPRSALWCLHSGISGTSVAAPP